MKSNTKITDVGTNRTGIDASPKDAKEMIEGVKQFMPGRAAMFDGAAIEEVRRSYSEEAAPVGTMPPPGSIKGVVSTLKEAVKGDKATVLLDALAERLAFERTGTRLYEALLAKFDAADVKAHGPTRAELEKIRDDELSHVALLEDCLRKLGGDPTAMTPSADTVGVLGSGLVKVLTDPRSTFTQSLKAILVAELTDNDSWDSLADLADKFGQTEMGEQFALALEVEEQHLANVRIWLQAAVQGQAGVADVDNPKMPQDQRPGAP